MRATEAADAVEPVTDGAAAAARDVMGVGVVADPGGVEPGLVEPGVMDPGVMDPRVDAGEPDGPVDGAYGMRAAGAPEDVVAEDVELGLFPSVRSVMREESPASMRGFAGAVGVGRGAGASGAAPVWGGSVAPEPVSGAAVTAASVDETTAAAAGLDSAGATTPGARNAVDATVGDTEAASASATGAFGAVMPAAVAVGAAVFGSVTTSGDWSAAFSVARAAGCSAGCAATFFVARLAIVREEPASIDSDDSADSADVASDDAASDEEADEEADDEADDEAEADFAAFVALPLMARGSASTALDDGSGASSSTAVALAASALACAAPANHSRTVSARPTDTGERWLTMSGISSAWQRATMSLELTPSSLASW